MSLRAARLPIVSPCPRPDALELGDASESWCSGCAKTVHNLSAMGEREVRRLLERNVGASICVDYEVRNDGTIRVRSEPSPRWLVPWAALLSACAAHLEESELEPPSDCLDEDGCDESVARWWLQPEASTDEDHHESAERRPGEASPPAAGSEPRPPERGAAEVREAAPPRELAPAPAESFVNARVDFTVDGNAKRMRGCVVVQDHWHEADGRLRFVPTRRLLADLRDRIAARRNK